MSSPINDKSLKGIDACRAVCAHNRCKNHGACRDTFQILINGVRECSYRIVTVLGKIFSDHVYVSVRIHEVKGADNRNSAAAFPYTGGFWRILEIADTGNGIPQESIDKIFEPLFTTKAKGIGLGLAVCRSIIERHGGGIEVRSEVGKGTTFTIELPLRARGDMQGGDNDKD